jgi:GNAT superfamily N-acetyltransferase
VEFQKTRLFLRPLHPSDMRALQEFFYSHDEETVRLRYGYLRDKMTGESAFKLAAVDQARDLALGIFSEELGREEMRAVGRFYLEEGGTSAEVAFVVHEENRHMGIAGYLLGELAAVAKKRGIAEFWASVLPDNRAMAGLFLAVGAVESKSGMDGERELRMSVDRILKSRKKFLERKKIRRIER